MTDQTDEVAKVVRAERFELVDKEGKVRAVLLTEDGRVTLALSDKDGDPRVGLDVRADGSPSLSLLDKSQVRVLLDVDDSGEPKLLLTGQEGRPQVLLAQVNGLPCIQFGDAPDGSALLTMDDKNRCPFVIISDQEGRRRVMLTLGHDYLPHFVRLDD